MHGASRLLNGSAIRLGIPAWATARSFKSSPESLGSSASRLSSTSLRPSHASAGRTTPAVRSGAANCHPGACRSSTISVGSGSASAHSMICSGRLLIVSVSPSQGYWAEKQRRATRSSADASPLECPGGLRLRAPGIPRPSSAPPERLHRRDRAVCVLDRVDRHPPPEEVADDRRVAAPLFELLEEPLILLDPGAHEFRARNLTLHLAYSIAERLDEIGSSLLQLVHVIGSLNDVPPFRSFPSG